MEVFITLKTTGIIVEYNPLHPGHIYHMEQARKQTGADYLIAVMTAALSSGALALLDKYTRTRMALLAGADVVIELPVCFATGSAGDFCRRGSFPAGQARLRGRSLLWQRIRRHFLI